VASTHCDSEESGGNVVQKKTGKALWLPMHPQLRETLEAMTPAGDYVVMTQYGEPFSIKALGMRMREWADAASVPPGCTLHGLRKTLGVLLAERGSATTRQLMSVLGHDHIKHAELYTRDADQRRLATEAIRKLADAGWIDDWGIDEPLSNPIVEPLKNPLKNKARGVP
jgi:integrase